MTVSLGAVQGLGEAAAAIAIDGRIAAATSDRTVARAVETCVHTAGVSANALECVTFVGDGTDDAWVPSAARRERIEPLRADALHAADGADVRGVLVGSTQPVGLAAFALDGRLRESGKVDGLAAVAEVAGALASALGLDADDPFASLDRLSHLGEPEFATAFDSIVGSPNAAGIRTDLDELARLLRAPSDPGWDLRDHASLNMRLQARRRALAMSFTRRLARVIHEVAQSIGAGPLAFGGGLFANPAFATEFRALAGDEAIFAAVPESIGRALGAALEPFSHPLQGGRPSAPRSAFSDGEVKSVLDNCRLDYVYEPDWSRLLSRISKMLSQGKVIAWFQGPQPFGPRPLGARSILCDPSSRYARANVNEYLRAVPLDDPLPVILSDFASSASVGHQPAVRSGVFEVAVMPTLREQLVSALDSKNRIRLQSLAAGDAPELRQLLDIHYHDTGVPGLIETSLADGASLARSPRDAVRIVYSSAIDALVIGRFLLMKDHWLLRSQGQ